MKTAKSRGKPTQCIPTLELIHFTRRFGKMLEAGQLLVHALELLAKDESLGKKLCAVVDKLRRKVQAHSTLSDALKTYPAIFDTMYVHLVATGEVGRTTLDTAMASLANRLKRERALAASKEAMNRDQLAQAALARFNRDYILLCDENVPSYDALLIATKALTEFLQL